MADYETGLGLVEQAWLSIAAIDLGHIIESMIRDGITRRMKGGRHSRTPVTSTMSGFLSELTRHIAGIDREAVQS